MRSLNLFGSRDAQLALTLIKEHMHTCEIDKREIKAALQVESGRGDIRHKQNTDRMDIISAQQLENRLLLQKSLNTIMFVLLTAAISALGAFGFEIVTKYH
jgi:hypothetical protein